MADVFDSIRTALTQSPPSGDIASVIASTRAALLEEAGCRVEYEATASDPLVASDVAEAAGDKLIRSHTTTKRLTAALDRLEPAHAAALHAEHQARIRPAYEKAGDERAKLLATFNREYPKHVAAIVAMLEKLRTWDHVAIEAPVGEPRLDSLKSDIRPVLYGLNLPDGAGGYAWGYDLHKPGHLQTMSEQAAAANRRPGEWP